MSAANNNRSRAPAPALKKFCKVCQDAGKSEKEYTNHFVLICNIFEINTELLR